MTPTRNIHPDFLSLLELKEPKLVLLFKDVRSYLLELFPDSNEILYHTHALTAVFSVSGKLGDAFCMIPIYTNHMNLGFNRGTLLSDPHGLLVGTGNLIRHIPIDKPADYRNRKVTDLVKAAIAFAIKDMDRPTKMTGETISKITDGVRVAAPVKKRRV